MDLAADRAVEAILRDELVRENRALTVVIPVLRYLLASEAQALVSEAIVARVRGMIHDLAVQLAAAAAGLDPATRGGYSADQSAHHALADALMADEAVLGFCHALATEAMIAERLQQRHAIDPVLSPLLQELIASEDTAIAALAMATLAAQSRFVQAQRRMELPLAELPAELFHAVIARSLADLPERAGLARLQASYDEASGRLALLARLVAAMRRGAVAALNLDHAGLALFASGLATHTRRTRAEAVLACHEGQSLRLALMLRAAGVAPAAAERQVLLIAPAGPMPGVFAELSPEQAAGLLAVGGAAQ